MNVRPCADEELETLIRLWHETSEATYGFLPTEKGRSFEDRRAYFLANIAPRHELWVAEEDGELLGFLAIDGDSIDRLYVHPRQQRRGVGRALLDKARELSPRGLRLFTHVENEAARRFYESQGFVALRFGTSPPPESAPDVEYGWSPADEAR